MKVLIVSDNHGDRDILATLKERHAHEVAEMIHCGDSELKKDDVLWNAFKPVEGNCDYANQFQQECVIELKGTTFLVVHGHQHRVKMDLNYIASVAKQRGIDYVLYGHTHIPKIDEIEGVYIINPGSISQPRYPYQEGTYAVIDFSDVVSIAYYTRDGSKDETLSGILSEMG